MKKIKTNFVDKIETSITEALGFHTLISFGKLKHSEQVGGSPNARTMFGVGHPNNPQRTILYAPKHIDIQRKVNEKPNVVLELYLTEIIQHWFDFLAELYQKALEENYFNSGSYSIPSSKVKLDLTLKDNDLYNSIIDSCVRDFDFLQAKEKLKQIKLTLAADLSNLQADEQLINENIQIRNILQHRLGKVSSKDLSDLGISSFSQDKGDSTIKISAGDRITRTVFDLEKLVISLKRVADKLVENCT
ncbi:hypothetical protein DC914_RS28015 [Vibrio parahaemolyticus]|nr:hypothetical protein [Vibrio parahaemolyticus]EGR3234952.1 hypothetical protein [Vibrio parahaemolyticus]EJG0181873.1 hypothetical protein [Vibrio parahaemolyticus]EJM9301962.1 hypothetical protein [Vibrio parahaemolyticus]HAS6594320.1 hypothetical protein [Vibrio parahaemolyticus]